MTRLIDADYLKSALEIEQYNDYDDLLRTERIIDNAPTIERPQGEWKVYFHCSDGFSYKCSLCERVVNSGHWFEREEILSVYPYCHCGAKMTSVADPIKWYSGLGLKYIKVGDTIYTQDDDKQGWTGRGENK